MNGPSNHCRYVMRRACLSHGFLQLVLSGKGFPQLPASNQSVDAARCKDREQDAVIRLAVTFVQGPNMALEL